MIFKSITLNNLFSYHGEITFQLAPPQGATGNVVVIMGRNGFGKTSLLNSVKLLFGGVTKDLMSGVQRGGTMTQKSFVLGHQDWWGILNHRARAAGITRCAVSAVLLDENAQETRVNRCWDIQGDNYKDQLQVITPRKGTLEGDVAQQHLSRLLPLDYIPFFFFDSEEVGYLAEANRNQTIEKMEQLLNIRPVDNVREVLKEIRRKWNRELLDNQSREALCKAENRHEELQLQVEELQEKKDALGAEIEDTEDSLRVIKQKIRLLRGTGNIENTARLEAEKRKEAERLAEALTALSTAFEHDAFLRLNSSLAQKALLAIESCANRWGKRMSELLDSLRNPLKEIFTTPPYPDNRLNEAQVLFYQTRIDKLLKTHHASNNEEPFKLGTDRANELVGLLAAYQPERSPTVMLQEQVARALAADQAQNAAEDELQNVNQLSDDNKALLKQLEFTQSEKESILLDHRDQLRKIDNDINITKREITSSNEQIASLQSHVKKSTKAQVHLKLLDNISGLLDAYKQRIKQEKREALENAFNTYLKQLLDSHALINKAQIDETFQLSYHDSNGTIVPMSSLSAGMKQLAATALLWALKNASGANLPIIFDTPLGRIDRQHQDNLLLRYYPQAGEQVILLPTDSELDERKRRLLAPYIYREYHLSNPTGEETQVELMQTT